MGNPLRISAIAPSGEALSRLITREISAAHGAVLELGPGTGVFTRGLLARGVRESDLTLVEFDPEFARLLQQRFPQARVLRMDATRLSRHELFPTTGAGAVVSGLPLLSFPPRQVMRILLGAFCHLRAEGGFYQFTYGPRCPVPTQMLERLGLEAVRIGGTVRNLPPATVYRITRRR
ncbi:MAG: methyltransferase domain-containing protein [Luteolibacter sp.]